MQACQFSETALGTAFMRVCHDAKEHPKIFDYFDPSRVMVA